MLFPISALLYSSTSIFLYGIFGFILYKRNLLILLMCLELMLVGVNLNFIFFSVFLDDILGQIFALYILTVAASESAVGLAIFMIYYQDRKTHLLEKYIRARG
jgi:NADH-quinone oxidoreductase subunit K